MGKLLKFDWKSSCIKGALLFILLIIACFIPTETVKAQTNREAETINEVQTAIETKNSSGKSLNLAGQTVERELVINWEPVVTEYSEDCRGY